MRLDQVAGFVTILFLGTMILGMKLDPESTATSGCSHESLVAWTHVIWNGSAGDKAILLSSSSFVWSNRNMSVIWAYLKIKHLRRNFFVQHTSKQMPIAVFGSWLENANQQSVSKPKKSWLLWMYWIMAPCCIVTSRSRDFQGRFWIYLVFTTMANFGT